MGSWHTDFATECGHEVYVHEDWDGPPRFCKDCKAENDAKWYDVSCADCGATIHAHRDWDHPPRYCPTCKAHRDAKWYDKHCEDCGASFRVCRDWDRTPRFCPSCKEKRDAQWTKRTCRKCGSEFRVKKDWDRPPEFCNDCKSGYKPVYKSCEHCADTFEIPVGLQLMCAEKDWELPRRCQRCRELFRHKPFRTVKETEISGQIVFKTYNSRGDLISESRKEKGVLGDQVRHQSRFGRDTGTTYVNGGVFGETVTRRPDGSAKSSSREFDGIAGGRYRQSRGGSSQTVRETRTEETWTGKKIKKTE